MVSRPVACLSGLLAALWPNLIIHSSLLLTDTVFVFFFSIMLLFCAKFVRAGRITDAAAAGLVCGLAVMTRPIAQFLPIALAIAAPMIVLSHGRGWRRASEIGRAHV